MHLKRQYLNNPGFRRGESFGIISLKTDCLNLKIMAFSNNNTYFPSLTTILSRQPITHLVPPMITGNEMLSCHFTAEGQPSPLTMATGTPEPPHPGSVTECSWLSQPRINFLKLSCLTSHPSSGRTL